MMNTVPDEIPGAGKAAGVISADTKRVGLAAGIKLRVDRTAVSFACIMGALVLPIACRLLAGILRPGRTYCNTGHTRRTEPVSLAVARAAEQRPAYCRICVYANQHVYFAAGPAGRAVAMSAPGALANRLAPGALQRQPVVRSGDWILLRDKQ